MTSHRKYGFMLHRFRLPHDISTRVVTKLWAQRNFSMLINGCLFVCHAGTLQWEIQELPSQGSGEQSKGEEVPDLLRVP